MWIRLLLIIFFIPFYIHLILIKTIKNFNRKNIFILNWKYKDKPDWDYIWIEENNLIWRKWNRYLSNYTEYNFYIEEKNNTYIQWKWIIKIFKTLLADKSFPISWEYIASIKAIYSDNFIFNNCTSLIKISNWSNIFHEIPFCFNLPNNWTINIIKWPWTLNNNISINIQTKIFYLLPKTNLKQKLDHLNRENFELKTNYKLEYDITYDTSPLKIQSIKIVEDGILFLLIQKELINFDLSNFKIYYKWNVINIEKVEKNVANSNLIKIFYTKWNIDFFNIKKNRNIEIPYLKVNNLEDKTWMIHYKNWRNIRFVWKINKK